MATLYNLGRSSGLWNTQLRTDCTAITKKPLKWEARNLDAYDAVVFFTDGDLDMDDSQKADLLSGFTAPRSLSRTGPSMARCSGVTSMGIRGVNSPLLSWWKIRHSRG